MLFITKFICDYESVYSSFHGNVMKKEVEQFVVSFVLTEQIVSQNNGGEYHHVVLKITTHIYSVLQ